MAAVPYIYDDGGRADAGFRGDTGDCVTRAIAIGTGIPYRDVYEAMWDAERALKGDRATGPRRGMPRRIYERFLFDHGWMWTPTMQIGQGCTVHLRADELPETGRIIVRLSRHLATVVDGVLHDNRDCSRGGTRCVYGYYAEGIH